MSHGMVKNTLEFRNAIRWLLADKGWTNTDLSRYILKTTNIPHFKPYTVTSWLKAKNETLTSTKFMALYPTLRPYLERAEWKPQSKRVKKMVNLYINSELKQGSLFDSGQTIDNPVAPIAPVLEASTPSEEGSVNVHCSECGSDLSCSWEVANGALVLNIDACEKCTEELKNKAMEELISTIRNVKV